MVIETETDIFRQMVIPKQQNELRCLSAMIYIMRTLPSQNMLGSFRKHTFEAHRGYDATYVVAIDRTRIAKHFRMGTKQAFYLVTLMLYLFTEYILISQGSKTMGIGLGYYLTTTSSY